MIEPLWNQRASLFSYDGYSSNLDLFVQSLLSEIRVYGDHDVSLSRDGQNLRLKWQAQDSKTMTLTLASAYPLDLKPITLFDSFFAREALGFTVIKCNVRDPAACEVEIVKPAWSSGLPPIAPIPTYSETLR